MNLLIIKETDDSPEIFFNKEEKEFVISGKSLPEDVGSFYSPLLEWLEEYGKDPLEETIISFKFTYFNTASSKIILDILMVLETIHEKGSPVLIKWYYPEYDEDMMEAGVEYSEMVDIPFEHIPHNP